MRDSSDAKWLGALRQAMYRTSSCRAMETLLFEASGDVSSGSPADGTTQRASPSTGSHEVGAQPSTEAIHDISSIAVAREKSISTPEARVAGYSALVPVAWELLGRPRHLPCDMRSQRLKMGRLYRRHLLLFITP